MRLVSFAMQLASRVEARDGVGWYGAGRLWAKSVGLGRGRRSSGSRARETAEASKGRRRVFTKEKVLVLCRRCQSHWLVPNSSIKGLSAGQALLLSQWQGGMASKSPKSA